MSFAALKTCLKTALAKGRKQEGEHRWERINFSIESHQMLEGKCDPSYVILNDSLLCH